jgi:hypothetical protein
MARFSYGRGLVLLSIGAAVVTAIGAGVALSQTRSTVPRAASVSPPTFFHGPEDVMKHVSALRSLAPMSSVERAQVDDRFRDLTDDTQAVPARVDVAIARKAGEGVYIALRSDGFPCLVTRIFSVCFWATLAGGVTLSPSAVRAAGPHKDLWDLTVSGLAVDGVKHVDLVFKDGSSLGADVANNVFDVRTVTDQDATDIVGYRVDGTSFTLGG